MAAQGQASLMTGMGGHHSASMKRDEWLTPPYILEALGPFDLDPCAPVKRPWPMAAKHFTIRDDGLKQVWHGRVWLNPPYGAKTETWLSRLRDHGDGIALIFARTETEAFFTQAWRADALLFLRGRLNFHFGNGTRSPRNAGAPSVLLAYGWRNAEALRTANLVGCLVTGQRIRP